MCVGAGGRGRDSASDGFQDEAAQRIVGAAGWSLTLKCEQERVGRSSRVLLGEHACWSREEVGKERGSQGWAGPVGEGRELRGMSAFQTDCCNPCGENSSLTAD